MSDENSKQGAVAEKRRPPNAGKGRPKGTVNKTTATLKEAILLAAELSGEDGKGRDGLTGYLRRVASEDVKAFCSLLGRVLPTEMRHGGPGGEPLPLVQPVFQINTTPVKKT